MLLCLCHQQITWHDKLVLLPHSFLRLVMCITLNQSDVPSALTQVYHRCLHLYTPALTHHSLSSLSPAVVTEEGLTPPAHGGHHARQHIHTAVLQLGSGAPYTHHSQLHLRTYRLSGSQQVCEWALSSTATSSCPCFDGHLHSQKEAAGWKDRDIRTCSKCTPVTVTAHSDWMQLAVLIIAAVYLLRESHSTVQTTSLLTHFTLTHTSTCTVCIYVPF